MDLYLTLKLTFRNKKRVFFDCEFVSSRLLIVERCVIAHLKGLGKTKKMVSVNLTLTLKMTFKIR